MAGLQVAERKVLAKGARYLRARGLDWAGPGFGPCAGSW